MIVLVILGAIFAGIVGVVEFAKAHSKIKTAEYLPGGKNYREVRIESE